MYVKPWITISWAPGGLMYGKPWNKNHYKLGPRRINVWEAMVHESL